LQKSAKLIPGPGKYNVRKPEEEIKKEIEK